MKIDKIEEYIKNKALLGKKDFPEIKRLIEEYPYFQTAHKLLVGAAKNANEKDLDKIIAKSSAFISDRHLLFSYVNTRAGLSDKNNISIVSNKRAGDIKSVKKVDESKADNKKDGKDKNVKSENIDLPEIKPIVSTEEEKLTEKGKSIHSSLIDDIIIPIVESEKTVNDEKDVKNNVTEEKKINENKLEVEKNTKDKKTQPKHIEKELVEKKNDEFKTSTEFIDHIVNDKLAKKENVPEIKKEISENDKKEEKAKAGIVTKSITDDIFDKIANLKVDKTKTSVIDGKSQSLKDKIEKTESVKKDDTSEIKVKTEKDKPIDIKKDKKVEEKIEKPESVKKDDTSEIKVKTEKDKPIDIKKDEKVEEKIEKPESVKKDDTSEIKVKKEKALELPDNEEKEFIKDVIAEIKGNKKEPEVDKKSTKTEKPEIKKDIEIKKDLKVEKEEDKDAADSIFNRIEEFKKKRLAGKEEKIERVNKFIQTEPKIDRTKEINIKGDVSKESTKEKKPVVTELMANILINQGHYNKAIEIFEKLILKNPEKKDYFAAKIKEVQKMKKNKD